MIQQLGAECLPRAFTVLDAISILMTPAAGLIIAGVMLFIVNRDTKREDAKRAASDRNDPV